MKTGSIKGKRILLTRSIRGTEPDILHQMLDQSGAEVLNVPLIEIEPFEDPNRVVDVFKGISTYDWIVFSSANGVRFFFEDFFRAFRDIRAFGPSRIACVGAQTAAAVSAFHLEVDLIPEDPTAEGLAAALVETGSLPSAYLLWVCGDKTNKRALETLEGKGEAILDIFQVYRSQLRELKGDESADVFRKRGADIVFFASPSAAESFVKQAKSLKLGANATTPKSVSIGPTTTAAMRKFKIPVSLECKSPGPEDVIKAFQTVLAKE